MEKERSTTLLENGGYQEPRGKTQPSTAGHLGGSFHITALGNQVQRCFEQGAGDDSPTVGLGTGHSQLCPHPDNARQGKWP
eukprot:g22040.t1